MRCFTSVLFKMSPRKQVRRLADLAMEKISHLVQDVVERVATTIVAYGAFVPGSSYEYRLAAVDHYVNTFRQHIFDHVIPRDTSDVVWQIISGVKNASDSRRFTWRPGLYSILALTRMAMLLMMDH